MLLGHPRLVAFDIGVVVKHMSQHEGVVVRSGMRKP